MKRILFLTICMLALLVPASSAFAHHADVTGTVDCAGNVAFTATAWAGNGDPLSQTNNSVTVSISGGTPATVGGVFNTGNGYAFSGTSAVAAGSGTTLGITYGTWGNGTAGGTGNPFTIPAPNNCVPVDVCTDALNPGNQPAGTVCIVDVCVDALNPGNQPTGTVCITPPPVTEPPVTEPPVTEPPVVEPEPPVVVPVPIPEPEPRVVTVHRGELPYTGNDEVIGIGILGTLLVGGGLYLHRRGRGNGDV
jgi:LPXTG-motif cell wall-anchored protein